MTNYGHDCRDSYLGQNIVHGFRGTRVVLSENPEESEDLDLEEGVGDARDVMLGGVAGHDQVLGAGEIQREVWLQTMKDYLEDPDEVGDDPFIVLEGVGATLAHLVDEDDAGDEDAVVLLRE